MKRIALFIIAAVAMLAARAGDSPNYYGAPQFVDTIKSKGFVTEVEFVTPRIVGVRHYYAGCTIGRHNLVVTRASENVAVTTTTSGNSITLSAADGATVKYNRRSGAVTFLDANGNEMLREASGGTTLTARKDAGADSYTVSQLFMPSAQDKFYGLGQLQNGRLNQRGATYNYMIQGNMSVWMPYIHSTKGYALMWNNASPTTYNDTSTGLTLESAVGFGVDYYFLLGSADDGSRTVAQMRELTGDVPMLPLWAYGFFQSKERYESANQTMGVAATYRRQHVPLDCVVQDWQYWGGNSNWNGMEFANPKFSNYKQMIDSVHRMHANMIISTWANFGPASKPYAWFRDRDLLIRQGNQLMTSTYPPNEGVAIYNAYSPAARDAYWQYLWEGLISHGIDGYWLDSSEPDHYQGGAEMEETFDFQVGDNYSWRSVRNAFPLVHVEGVYSHHRAQPELAGKRCMILTRSAYLGQQRTGANTWSGDISASWETLRNQIPAALNFTATGNPHWNSDIGAFFNGNLGGPGNDEYNELYARWFQFGTFCPMMRSHGSATDKAIYVWGTRGDKWYDNMERYIRLRYTLLPYIYSTAWAVHSRSESFMNALGLIYPADERGLDIKDEFLFGRSILVAPVTEYNARNRNVYLPQGSNWVNFHTGTRHQGGASVNAAAEVDVIPMFVKEGAILPLAKVAQYANVADWDTLQLRVYPGADGHLDLYSDSGDGYDYERGEYTEIPVEWRDAERCLSIGAVKGMPVSRVFDIVLAENGDGCGDKLTTSVIRIEYNGTAQDVYVDRCEKIEVVYDSDSDNTNKPIDAGNLKPYTFVPNDWTTGDPTRVSQSNISYNTADRTITVKATGNNNVCLELSKTRNHYYYVPQGHTWLWVKGSNLLTNPSASKVWFAFGRHVMEIDAMRVATAPDGDVIVGWNLASRLGEELLQPYIELATDGPFIFCFGLTSSTGTSVITNIEIGSESTFNALMNGDDIGSVSTIGTDTPANDATIYDLEGRSLGSDISSLTPGIYIRSGKKMIVK